ncbi:hypothetical protein [Pseudomonas entomophila]|uniref:hypothetical protein n=1 Tax=Pseudomonas entomophila TaxID=312306 RepID=UPI001EFF6B16|nr:hypothetical protein [Pseudomonas entomophila]MCG8296597.1 hypothetical protein [Pseudomonas entomophila]
MAVIKVESRELYCLIEKMLTLIDFGKDLPENVFVEEGLSFWFFERPLICYVDVFAGLISAAVAESDVGVYLKFSGVEVFPGSCYFFDGLNVSKDASWMSNGFNDFFGGEVGYPIILCGKGCDWMAFESAHEELGVIAVRSSFLSKWFGEYLDDNFISMSDLVEMKAGSSVNSKVAKAFFLSYFNG